MASLASLVVDLQLESAQLRAGLDQANAKLESFGKKADKIGKLVTGALSLKIAKDAALNLVGFIQKGAESADSMGKLAQSAGAPVEEFSKLAFAARMSGSSSEDMGNALERLSKGMSEASAGGAQQTALFNALGVSITGADGKMRSSTAVFGDITDALSQMEDGAEKTALAQDIFGKSGADLIPLMNEGRKGIDAAAESAKKFGLVVTAEGAKSAEAFNDSLDMMSEIGTGLAQRVAADLTPALTALIETFTESKTGADSLDGAASVLATTMRLLASAGTLVSYTFQTVGTYIAGVASALVSVAHRDFNGAKEALMAADDEVLKSAANTKTRLEAIWTKAKGPGDHLEEQARKMNRSAGEVRKHYKALEDAAKAAAKAEKEYQDGLDKSISKTLKVLQETMKGGRTTTAAKDALDRTAGVAKGQAPVIPYFTDLGDAVDFATKAFKQEVDAREEARILELKGGASNLQLADAALWAADELHASGDAAMKAADDLRAGGEEGKRAAIAAAEAAGEAYRAAWEGLQNKFLGRTGNIMGLVDSAQQGATVGGPWGAVAAVGLDLLTQSEQFSAIVDQVNTVIQYVADTLGTILGPALESLSPVLGFVAGLFETLKPVFEFVGSVLKGVVDIIAGVLNGIAMAWNGIIDAIDFALGWLGVNLSGMKLHIVDLTKATDEQTKSAEKATTANQEFTNVPAGYRTKLGIYNAQDPVMGGSPVVNNNNITINAPITAPNADAQEVVDLIQERIARKTGRSGDPFSTRFGRQEY